MGEQFVVLDTIRQVLQPERTDRAIGSGINKTAVAVGEFPGGGIETGARSASDALHKLMLMVPGIDKIVQPAGHIMQRGIPHQEPAVNRRPLDERTHARLPGLNGVVHPYFLAGCTPRGGNLRVESE